MAPPRKHGRPRKDEINAATGRAGTAQSQGEAKAASRRGRCVMMQGTVISLCDRTGNMCVPWLEAGYTAITD